MGSIRFEMSLTNFPVQLTSFIGREREIADIKRLLFSSHLVSLTGTGGSGKTRLAIQIANAIGEAFADGVWMVDFAPLHEPALVPQIVTQALSLSPAADEPLMETLLDFIRSKQLLLILDNCEHLTEACAQLTQELLSQSPELRILATSREPLAITGETIYPVSGLSWPSDDERLEANLQNLMRYDAVRLFIERARAISPNFSPTPENIWPTVEVCRRLDGLPLALELASARVNVLSIHEIALRLNDRFTLLVSSQRRGLEPRHHTLRAAIDWSYDLLSPDEQALLRHMAVFEAGCSLDMLESICTGDMLPKEPILDLISLLVSKSLVVAEATGRVQVRFRLLETIREYLLEKLALAGEEELWRDRHLNLFLARVEKGAPKLGGTYQQLWLNWLDGEQDNLRAALTWALEKGANGVPDRKRIESGLRIASAVVLLWQIRGNAQEGLGWFERLLAKADDSISLDVLVNAIVSASFLALFLGKGQASLEYGREAVKIAEAAGDEGKPILGFALAGLASGAKAAGDYLSAFQTGERAVQLFRESGPPLYLGMALISQGEITLQLGNFAIARERLSESLTLAQNIGDTYRIAHTLNMQGDLARLEQNYPEAVSKYEQSEALLRELNAQQDLASVICSLGFTSLFQGKIDRGQTLFRESLNIHKEKQNKRGMTDGLIGLAAIAVMAGLHTDGARLLAATVAITGMPAGSGWPATQMEFERYHNLVRAKLTDTEYQAEQAMGQIMTIEQAVNYALNLPFPPGTLHSTLQTQDGLTGREREIAALIGQGMTNGEIATELVLSKRTVETHASHILSKLGLSSRAQIIRWAMDHGLAKDPAR
jgi:predicted ATPase/DNA-binding CsgD family transcriptional regulator